MIFGTILDMIFLVSLVVIVAVIGVVVMAARGKEGASTPALQEDAVLLARDVVAQDARSVLRPVYLFLALGVSVATALYGASQMLFYALGRLLGVPRPGGVGGSLALALAGPASLLVVFGVSWLYQRQALALQARVQTELPGQAGIRRLYTYLVSLIALGLLSTGAGGLLWTIADLLSNAPHTVNSETWWREQISLYATLLAVGLPIWLRHWAPVADRRPSPEEAASLARRLYVYITLLAGVLTLLGSGVVVLKQLLDLALGEASTPSVITNLMRALAISSIAGVAVAYHQRVLRVDLHRQETRGEMQEATSGRREGILEGAHQPAAGAPSAGTLPFGVVYRQRSGEASAWYATADEARTAYWQLREGGDPTEWIALVKVEAADRS